MVKVIVLSPDIITLTGKGLESVELDNGIDLAPMKYVL